MVQQGGDHLPLAISGRLLVAFWWLFVIVTVTTYSGNLVAVLTFPKLINPIENVKELLSYRRSMHWGVDTGGAMEELIEIAQHGPLHDLRKNMRYYRPEDREYIYKQVKRGRMAFISSDTEIRYLITDDFKRNRKCGLMIAKDPVYSAAVSFVINKGRSDEFKSLMDREYVR